MAWGLKSSSFLQWYSNTGGVIIDRMCCCSYIDAQVCGETEATYYRTRSTTVPTEWFFEDESPDKVSSPTETRDQEYEMKKQGMCPRALRDSPSFETVTTVPMNTRSYDSCTTQDESSWGGEIRNITKNCICDTDIALDSKFNFGIRPHNFKLDQANDENTRHPQFGKTLAPPRHRLNCDSRYVLRQVQQEGLANLPYLHFTEGYKC